MITTFITRLFHLIRTKWIKRFECLLPTKHNDGTAIDGAIVDKTTKELCDRFAGLTLDIVHARGFWRYQGTLYRDDLVRIRIDTSDPGAVAYLREYKQTLKHRFRQLDIWITAHEIEII